jgi:hypothetical protein
MFDERLKTCWRRRDATLCNSFRGTRARPARERPERKLDCQLSGHTYVRLTFAEGATVPQGTMSIGQSIHVDDEGNVASVTAASSTPTRMLDIRWNDGVLSFGINDGPDVDRFEFRLIDANHAEMAMILSEEERRQAAAERLPLPKPFRLTKTP